MSKAPIVPPPVRLSSLSARTDATWLFDCRLWATSVSMNVWSFMVGGRPRFCARVAKRGGRAVKCMSAHGVHMGVKRGRGPGDRLGYSQIVNPLYMLRKGTMSAGEVLGQIFRNVASNAIMAVRPEPFVDRRGRLRGNMRGFADVFVADWNRSVRQKFCPPQSPDRGPGTFAWAILSFRCKICTQVIILDTSREA